MTKGAALLGHVFALVAMGVSVAFAVTLTDNERLQWLLAVLSILAVCFERGAVLWARNAKERNDRTAVAMARVLLIVTATYTAGMQIGFFGSVFAAPAARDAAAQASIGNLDKQINDAETRRSWLPQPPATAEAMRRQLADIKRDPGTLRREIIGLQAMIAAAESRTEVELEIAGLRARRAEALSKPASDIKAELFKMFGGDGHWAAYITAALSVIMLQLGQICLPVVAGAAPTPPAQPQAPAVAAPVAVPPSGRKPPTAPPRPRQPGKPVLVASGRGLAAKVR